jgi:hypothetical protein
MSESGKVQKYVLLCTRLAAECRNLAADAPERDLSLTLANFKRAHRLCGTRNIGSFSTIL